MGEEKKEMMELSKNLSQMTEQLELKPEREKPKELADLRQLAQEAIIRNRKKRFRDHRGGEGQ